MSLTRRNILKFSGAAAALGAIATVVPSLLRDAPAKAGNAIKKLMLSDAEWQKRLKPLAYRVLRQEATERPWTSPLNDVKDKGTYNCAGCDLALFSSETKYDSRTGWPSFYAPIDETHIGRKTDWVIGYPRSEYHCAKCGGHQGHVFKDGPAPTGLRYCNNGVALTFKADTTAS